MIFHHFSPFFGGLETKSFPPVVVGEEEVFNNSNQDWSILTKLKKNRYLRQNPKNIRKLQNES